MKKLSSQFYVQLFVLLVLPASAFAQGGLANADKIISAKILPWAAAAGAAWCGIGLVNGFVKLSNGDQDGKEQIVRAGIGAAGCAGAAALLALVLSWAK